MSLSPSTDTSHQVEPPAVAQEAEGREETETRVSARLSCSRCNYTSLQADKMEYHMAAHDSGELVCHVCNKAFVRVSATMY